MNSATILNNITVWYEARCQNARDLRIKWLAAELNCGCTHAQAFAEYVTSMYQPEIGLSNPLHSVKILELWEEFNYDKAINAYCFED